MLQTILENLTKRIFEKLEPSLIPVGCIIMLAKDTPVPQGYLECNGSSYPSSTYPKLSLMCANFTGIDGVPQGHFSVPDFRGLILKGSDLSNPSGYTTETINSDTGTLNAQTARVFYCIKHDP